MLHILLSSNDGRCSKSSQIKQTLFLTCMPVRQKRTTYKNENKEIIRRIGKGTNFYWYFKVRNCFSFLTTELQKRYFYLVIICTHLMTGGYYAAVTASKCNKFPVFFSEQNKKRKRFERVLKPEGRYYPS